MKYKWEQIQKAVNELDRLTIGKIGRSFDKPRLEQEGVTVPEVVEQVLSMAPGDHPHLGPILLDLEAKLRGEEWH